MLASAVDIQGAPVTAHVTYLSPEGDKVNLGEGMPSRKMLGPVGGHEGVSVRLTPLPRVLALGGVLGIAEGLETALSASLLNLGMPVWAALNTALLSTFVPPDTIRKLIIFADNDVAGMKAAWKLRDRVNLPCELRVPGSAHKDFNDQLRASKSPHKKTPNLPN
jgi:putative DNA primase/helicase